MTRCEQCKKTIGESGKIYIVGTICEGHKPISNVCECKEPRPEIVRPYLGESVFCSNCGKPISTPTEGSMEERLSQAWELLALILPMALGYAGTHPVGNNAQYCQEAEDFLRAARSPKP